MRQKVLLGGLAATQIAASVLTQVVVLAILGPGRETDAFVAAQTIPLVLVSITGTSLQSAWQPRLARAEGQARAVRASQLFSQSLMVSFAMCVIALALTPIIGKYLFIGFDEQTRELFGILSYITVLSIPFNVLLLSFVPIYRANGRFLVAEAIPAVVFLISLGLLPVLLQKFGVAGAAFTVLFRSALSAVVLWAAAGRPGITARWEPISKDIGPLLAGSSLYKTGPVVDRFWGSHAPSGEMTLFTLVQAGLTAVAAVVERTIGGPAQPQFARLWAAGDAAGFRLAVWRVVLQSWVVLSACTALLFLAQGFAPAVLGVTIGLSPDRSREVLIFCWTLMGFFWVAAAGGIPVTAFYAVGDTRTPVIVGSIGFLVGVFLKFFGYTRFGMVGVGLSTSFYYVANFVVTGFLLERRLRRVATPRRSI